MYMYKQQQESYEFNTAAIILLGIFFSSYVIDVYLE